MNLSSFEPDVTGLPRHDLRLRQWINDWYACAISDGFIEAPYELDDATAERLAGYFDFGLTPDEGVGAVFRPLH